MNVFSIFIQHLMYGSRLKSDNQNKNRNLEISLIDRPTNSPIPIAEEEFIEKAIYF
jgi:hypothetical protein